MKLIAIDGACRRNGKPDCTSAGGAFYHYQIEGVHKCGTLSAYEYCSTNQRGELLALIKALDHVCSSNEKEVTIVTDSEYLFNAMTKKWYASWHNKGWVTSAGEPVKNRDIWLQVLMLMRRCDELDLDPMFFHIKGHCIPFGRVTADNLLAKDPTGKMLMQAMYKKFDTCAPTKQDVFSAAQALSERNNGTVLLDEVFRDFVVMNSMADAIATKVVDLADSSRKR